MAPPPALKEPVRAPRLLAFMTSMTGRVTKVLAGILMILFGGAMGGFGGWLLALAGLAPILSGMMDLCLTGPFFGSSIKGSEVRHDLQERPNLIRAVDRRDGRIGAGGSGSDDEDRFPPFAA